MSEWISVEERLPEEWKDVLVAYQGGEGRFVGIAWMEERGKWDAPEWRKKDGHLDFITSEPGNVIHWMPLPEPPEDKP